MRQTEWHQRQTRGREETSTRRQSLPAISCSTVGAGPSWLASPMFFLFFFFSFFYKKILVDCLSTDISSACSLPKKDARRDVLFWDRNRRRCWQGEDGRGSLSLQKTPKIPRRWLNVNTAIAYRRSACDPITNTMIWLTLDGVHCALTVFVRTANRNKGDYVLNVLKRAFRRLLDQRRLYCVCMYSKSTIVTSHLATTSVTG